MTEKTQQLGIEVLRKYRAIVADMSKGTTRNGQVKLPVARLVPSGFVVFLKSELPEGMDIGSEVEVFLFKLLPGGKCGLANVVGIYPVG